ncbi:MAG: MoaD/ThiS family protein [Chloroflexota bacterium]|jgi:sulfur carrier protein ThiS|nr:MoaD/ThiS family protein [Chloroflexota bacterium]
MQITVRGFLNSYTPEQKSTFEFDLVEPTKLFDVFNKLNLPLDALQYHVVVINNKALVPLQDTLLDQDDDVLVFPPISGG